MRRWDVVVAVSGSVAVLAFAVLVAVMVDPKLMDLSAPAYAGLAAGALGVVIGFIGMSRVMEAESASLQTDGEPFSMDRRLDVYRHLRRVRSRSTEQ